MRLPQSGTEGKGGEANTDKADDATKVEKKQ